MELTDGEARREALAPVLAELARPRTPAENIRTAIAHRTELASVENELTRLGTMAGRRSGPDWERQVVALQRRQDALQDLLSNNPEAGRFAELAEARQALTRLERTTAMSGARRGGVSDQEQARLDAARQRVRNLTASLGYDP
jgi:hypothetical protein